MRNIGILNDKILGKYKNKLFTKEVVLTEEREKHIFSKHLLEYEKLKDYIKEIIEEPDYIIDDNRHSDTIILLKELNDIFTYGRVVIKLSLSNDKIHSKNSIITLMELNKRTWYQTVNNRGEIIFDKSKVKEYN